MMQTVHDAIFCKLRIEILALFARLILVDNDIFAFVWYCIVKCLFKPAIIICRTHRKYVDNTVTSFMFVKCDCRIGTTLNCNDAQMWVVGLSDRLIVDIDFLL